MDDSGARIYSDVRQIGSGSGSDATGHRIGDSVTNNLTPLNACLLTSVALMEKYRSEGLNRQEPGIGTVLAAQAPFSIAFLAAFLIQLAIFYYFKIPIGVNA